MFPEVFQFISVETSRESRMEGGARDNVPWDFAASLTTEPDLKLRGLAIC